MPLKKGKSRKVIGENIETEEAAGEPYRVARARALNKAFGPSKKRKSKEKPKARKGKK